MTDSTLIILETSGRIFEDDDAKQGVSLYLSTEYDDSGARLLVTTEFRREDERMISIDLDDVFRLLAINEIAPSNEYLDVVKELEGLE